MNKVKTFGDQVREARFFKRLSQDVVSLKTGIDHGRLSRIERGFVQPSPRERAALRRLFGRYLDGADDERS